MGSLSEERGSGAARGTEEVKMVSKVPAVTMVLQSLVTVGTEPLHCLARSKSPSVGMYVGHTHTRTHT